ncbi:MAG: hypothetical protein LIR46_06895 [Bacteroidota bacterium]|nr:hypothetical protein [Bacteroidota bacterium]
MITRLRKEYKGSTAKDERLKLLCDIRHQHTRYDKLAHFYSIYPEKRSQLNKTIHDLIEAGPDGIDNFRKRVKKLEDYVNLNMKKAKERFLNEKIVKIRVEHPEYSYSLAEKCAETVLADHIRKNNEHIVKLKEYRNDDTRLD